MATASPEKLSGDEAGNEDAEDLANGDLRQLPERVLHERSQRMQEQLDRGIDGRLPDGGKKFLLTLRAVRRELARRQPACSAPPSPSSRPPRPHGRHGESDDDRCERIVQPRCVESSGLASDSNKNHGLTKYDFMSTFWMDEEVGVDVSCLEITSKIPGEPKTLVENEGKLCEEEESCKPARQPTDLSHKESYIDKSTNTENMSADDDRKDNGHTRICEHALTPSRKRKGAASVNFSMRLRSRKEDQSGPIILHLDSLKFHSSRLIFSVVDRFLKEEWSYLSENSSLTEFPIQEMVWKNLPRKIEKKPIAVPQQENEYDCGLFVLYYLQRFIEDAPERLYKNGISMFGKGWFQPEEASALRKKMQTLLLHLFEEAKPKNNIAEPTTTLEHPLEGISAKTTVQLRRRRQSTLWNAFDAATMEVNDVTVKLTELYCRGGGVHLRTL